MHKSFLNYVYYPNHFFLLFLWSLIQLLAYGFKTKLIIFAISKVPADMDSDLSIEYFTWENYWLGKKIILFPPVNVLFVIDSIIVLIN